MDRWRVWGGGAVLVGAGLIALVAARGSDEVEYVTVEAFRGTLTVTVTATGTLEPVNEVNVGSELSGTAITVEVDFNDAVEAGQVLAILDSQELDERVAQSRAAVESAEASVLSAEATVRETQLDRDRCAALAVRDVCSPQQLDRADAAHARALAESASARAQVSVSQANLQSDLTRRAKAVITSPISGIVIARYLEPGQTMAAAFRTPVLFTLAEDLSKMELIVDVDEADVGTVQEEQIAHFTVDAFPDRPFPARITSVRFAPQTVAGVAAPAPELFEALAPEPPAPSSSKLVTVVVQAAAATAEMTKATPSKIRW